MSDVSNSARHKGSCRICRDKEDTRYGHGKEAFSIWYGTARRLLRTLTVVVGRERLITSQRERRGSRHTVEFVHESTGRQGALRSIVLMFIGSDVDMVV